MTHPTMRSVQPSRALSDPSAAVSAAESTATIRSAIAQILPGLADLPATWHHCLVAFTADGLPLVGEIPEFEGVHIFSGFGNPLVFVPPLARRYARYLTGTPDAIVEQLSPGRL